MEEGKREERKGTNMGIRVDVRGKKEKRELDEKEVEVKMKPK